MVSRRCQKQFIDTLLNCIAAKLLIKIISLRQCQGVKVKSRDTKKNNLKLITLNHDARQVVARNIQFVAGIFQKTSFCLN